MDNFQFEALLQIVSKAPCPASTATKPSTIGFAKPFGLVEPDSLFLENVNGYGFTNIIIEERKIKRSELDKLLSQNVKALRSKGESVSRRKLTELRKQIAAEMLPNVIPTETVVPVVFDFKNSELWLTKTSSKVEASIQAFLMGLGIASLPKPISVTIEQALTQLLSSPNLFLEKFDLGQSVAMRELGESCQVRYVSQDLCSKELELNMKKNKDVCLLEMTYRDSIRFRVRSSQDITNIAYKKNDVNEWLEYELDGKQEEDYLDYIRNQVGFHIEVLATIVPPIYKMFASLNDSESSFEISEN